MDSKVKVLLRVTYAIPPLLMSQIEKLLKAVSQAKQNNQENTMTIK